MKNYSMFIRIGISAFLLFLSEGLYAQYTGAIGARVGGTSGITGKYFFQPTVAVEGIIGGFGNGFSITGVIEKYRQFDNAEGLYLYYGGGAHVAFYNGPSYNRFGREVDNRQTNDVGFGVDGIIGIEYRLPDNIPIAFSLDLKPFLEIGTGGYMGFAPDPSIGIKFIIK